MMFSTDDACKTLNSPEKLKKEKKIKKSSISASSIATTTKLMLTWKLMFPLSRFFAAWFYPPLKGSRWAIPSDARLCRGAPPRCAHRDGVDAESGTGRRVTFWHCKGSIPSQLRQRPSSCGAPRPQASFLVSQPVCVFVRACSAAVPCCTRRLSILVQRRAKRIGETLHLLQSRGCLSVCTAAQRYKRCGSVSNITAASKSGCVCGFWCDAALYRTRQGWMGPSCIILGCHLMAFLFSWIVIPLMGRLVQLQIFAITGGGKLLLFPRQLLVLPFEGPGWADST